MTGQGLSAVLLVGFPWLVGLTTEKEAMLFSAPLMLAVSLTRAPIMVPLSSMYTFAISYFTRRRSGLLTVMRMLGAVLGVGVIIAGLAWLVGPPLLDLIEPEYVIAGAVLAWLTIGAACIAMISLTGILCQARAAYATYIGGWVVAVIVAIIILVLPQPLQWRVIVALIVGPISGIIVHLAALSHRRGNVVPPQ